MNALFLFLFNKNRSPHLEDAITQKAFTHKARVGVKGQFIDMSTTNHGRVYGKKFLL
jgi:hypothetical protein